jgi:hypothetical protein
MLNWISVQAYTFKETQWWQQILLGSYVVLTVNLKFDSENKMGSITSLVIEPGASNSTTSYFLMMSTTSNARYCSIVTIIRNTHANVQTVPYVYIKPSALFLNKYAYNYMEIYNIC